MIECNLTSSRVIVIDVASQLEQSSYNSCAIDDHTKHIVHTEHHEEQIPHGALTHVLHFKREKQVYVSVTLSKHLRERQHENEQNKESQHIEHEDNKHVEAERVQIVTDKVFQASSHLRILWYFFFEKKGFGSPQIWDYGNNGCSVFFVMWVRGL